MADFKDFLEASLFGFGRKPGIDPTELERMRQSSEEKQREEMRKHLFERITFWAKNEGFSLEDLVSQLRIPRSELNRLVQFYQVATEEEIINFFKQEREKAIAEKQDWMRKNKRNARDRARRSYQGKFGKGPTTIRGPWDYNP